MFSSKFKFVILKKFAGILEPNLTEYKAFLKASFNTDTCDREQNLIT